jgi:hypothetical protein
MGHRKIKQMRMRWTMREARVGEEGKVYRVLVGNSEGKRPLGRPRRRWDIKDFRETGW